MSEMVQSDMVVPIDANCLLSLVENLDACIYIKDLEHRYVFVNRTAAAFVNATPSDILGKTDSHFFDLSKSPGMVKADGDVLLHGSKVNHDEVVVLQSGEQRVLRTAKLPVFDGQCRIVGLCGMSIDVTERQRAIDQLVEQNALLSIILANVDASVYLKDGEGRYLYANAQVVNLYGRPLPDIIGRTDVELLAPDVAEKLHQFDRRVMVSGTRQALEEALAGADGAVRNFWTTKMPLQLPGQPPCLIGFSTEITELLQLRKLLEHERITDSLTGLPNRAMFEKTLTDELAAASSEEGIAVVIADVDQFRYINTNFGQATGDQLIQQIGNRLQRYDVSIHHLARLSGDEFAFILRHTGSMETLAATMELIRAHVSRPYTVTKQPLHLTFSAGISLFRDDGGSASELLEHAETAMYSAKDNGRDQYRFYSSSLGSTIAERVQLERDLRSSIGSDQFELHYQPKITRDGSIAGVEALIRWNRPGRGLVKPDNFIPLAEQLGLLLPLGRWVITKACRQVAIWSDLGLGNIPIAVNLSISQLTNPALPDFVFKTIRDNQLADGCLEMEITESMMMDDPEAAIGMLHRLRAGGVVLSIDDFGTGFSSMAYLRQLPATCLKLDRSFVKNVALDAKDADLCAGITALAHKLGMSVVAEGIETQEQYDALISRECDFFQGYLFSRPLSEHQATQFLRAAARVGRDTAGC